MSKGSEPVRLGRAAAALIGAALLLGCADQPPARSPSRELAQRAVIDPRHGSLAVDPSGAAGGRLSYTSRLPADTLSTELRRLCGSEDMRFSATPGGVACHRMGGTLMVTLEPAGDGGTRVTVDASTD